MNYDRWDKIPEEIRRACRYSGAIYVPGHPNERVPIECAAYVLPETGNNYIELSGVILNTSVMVRGIVVEERFTVHARLILIGCAVMLRDLDWSVREWLAERPGWRCGCPKCAPDLWCRDCLAASPPVYTQGYFTREGKTDGRCKAHSSLVGHGQMTLAEAMERAKGGAE